MADIRDEHHDAPWPRLLCLDPRRIVLLAGALVAAAWAVFLVTDILLQVDPGDRRPMWSLLFNDRFVEWAQWILLGLSIAAAGMLAGRLSASGSSGAQSFFTLMSIGLVFMLFEDAGDARHTISGWALQVVGERPLGLPHQVVSDMPYFAAIAAIPVYALVRYGKHPWSSQRTRPFLLGAFGLYGLAAFGSGIRHLGDVYVKFGEFIDREIFRGRLPMGPYDTERGHFVFVDGAIEESIETMAAACMLAMMLAFAYDLRSEPAAHTVAGEADRR